MGPAMQLELELRSAPLPVVGSSLARPAIRAPLLQLVEAFLLSAVENHGTRRNYRAYLVRCFGIIRVSEPAAVTLPRLAALRAAVVGTAAASSTQAGMLCAVRAFLSWATLVEGFSHLSLDAVRRVLRLPRVRNLSLPQIPDDEELPLLFELAPVACGTRAMLAVFLGAGLRISELCSLDHEDLQVLRDGSAVLLVRGKGDKDRVVPIHPPVVTAVRAYLRQRTGPADLAASVPLFVAHDPGAGGRGRQRISARSVRRRFRRLFLAAGITRRVTVHSLRHKFAMAMVEGGVDLNRIRAVLGHASLVTTQRYVDHISSHHLRSAVPGHLVPDDPCPPGGIDQRGIPPFPPSRTST
jgi:integrase/recombinase XerC